jgi:hypothetical protein
MMSGNADALGVLRHPNLPNWTKAAENEDDE